MLFNKFKYGKAIVGIELTIAFFIFFILYIYNIDSCNAKNIYDEKIVKIKKYAKQHEIITTPLTICNKNKLDEIQKQNKEEVAKPTENKPTSNNEAKPSKKPVAVIEDTQPKKEFIQESNWISIANYFSSSFANGSTQRDVDENVICLMDDIGAEFGVSKPKLMGGHREYGLEILCNVSVGTIINVSYNNIEYKYQVVESLFCYEDEVNDDFIDINGVGHLDLYSNNDILQIYTCYGNHIDGRWFVKAKRTFN